jgi:GNAT superfamily N-acetyltransferase
VTEPGREQTLPARVSSRPEGGLSGAGGQVKPPNIAARTSEVTLRDGSRVILRPAVPADRALLAAGFERLSPESRYRRFFAPMNQMSPALLDYLTNLDYRDHFAWGALSVDPGPDGQPLGVGVARYIRLEDPEAAEMAVTVVDDWQGRGLGRVLLDALVLEALENGITRLEGDVLVENRPMQELLRREGATLRPGGPGVLRFSIDLPARDEALRGDPLGDLLRAVAKGEASLYQDEPCPWLSGVERPPSGLEG